MKKIIAGILIGAMVLSLSACNHTPTEDSLIYETKSSSTASMSESTSSATESSASSSQIQPEKPIAPSGWKYPEIDLSKGKYTAEKLDFGEISPIVDVKTGFFIVQRAVIDLEYADKNIAIFVDYYLGRKFNEMVAEIEKDMEIELSDFWKDLKLDDIK